MLKEMPRKYWKNMPEAALIPDLIAGAQAREAAMVDLGRQDFGPPPATLPIWPKAWHHAGTARSAATARAPWQGKGSQRAAS
jgi:hypothetical protein